VLDTWRPLLRADCSTLRILRPALAADLTRCPTLNTPRPLRIAPLTTPCARAGHGSLRATDCSVVSTWNSAPPADCSACETWYSPPVLDCSIPGVSHPVPSADCSALGTWRSMTVYGSLRTLTLRALVPPTDCSVLDT